VEAIDLVSWMLTKDPKQRPSVWELFSHSWLQRQSTDETPRTSHDLSVSILTRLKNFRAGSKMRQAALHLITSQFTETCKYEELRNVFLSLDVNNDGKLSREELMAGYRLLKLGSVEEVDRIMEICDTDRNGYLDYTEFLTATMSWDNLEVGTLDAAFRAFDKDGDGEISANELKFLLEDVDEEMDDGVWEQLVREGDADRDGTVCPK
jgi:calcium-dependent protein kinase